MYNRRAQGWIKHLDFMLVDIFSLQLAFIIAVYYRYNAWAYDVTLYREFGLYLILIDALVLIMDNSLSGVMRRGYYIEGYKTIQHTFIVLAAATVIMFATQTGVSYSRIILFLMFVLHTVIGYITRVLWKFVVRHYKLEYGKKKNMLVVTTPDDADHILKQLEGDHLHGNKITGIILTEHSGETTIGGYPVVADVEHATDYIVREWVDSVYIDAPFMDEKLSELINNCSLMGIPVHYRVLDYSRSGAKHFSEDMGGTVVLTSTINYITPFQLFLKRVADILSALIGSLIALVIIAIVGPIIKKQSPGPILFKQERIGKNGKHFMMYKIRSMHIDAEARKKELAADNRVQDGMMFKLDFDPRIIGNEILPDGTKKTGIGEFIRRTSLDEFPQFFNVLKGDMSLIGTRPPTLDEWEKYEKHHRARLAIRPGITGLWQVSGRSEITDFEEIVQLDTDYINQWTPGMDIKIFLKTILVVFRRDGAM